MEYINPLKIKYPVVIRITGLIGVGLVIMNFLMFPRFQNTMEFEGVDQIIIENIDSDGGALMGFTITNGYGQGASFEDFISMAADEETLDSLLTHVLRAGGISVGNASPYLKDLHITNNTARNVGGGIGLINSNAVIESCQIAYNTIPDGDGLGGGGIAINGGHPILKDVTIEKNNENTKKPTTTYIATYAE